MHLAPALVRLATEDNGSLITVGGLPLHPLAVHAVVVLLPLSALGLMAVILVPKWRAHFAKLALAGLAVGTVATYVAVQAGEQLAVITGISEEHRRYGKLLGLVSVALLLAALAWFWSISDELRKGRKPRTILGHGLQALTSSASLVLALASLGLVAVVGHSGATAVWANRIAPAPTASASASATASSSTGKTGYTMATVAQHNSPSDCWTAINGKVYNLTVWINRHPGGPDVIKAICGVDGSAAFNNQHGNQGGPSEILATFKLGKLA